MARATLVGAPWAGLVALSFAAKADQSVSQLWPECLRCEHSKDRRIAYIDSPASDESIAPRTSEE